jgi:hypothetical protein
VVPVLASDDGPVAPAHVIHPVETIADRFWFELLGRLTTCELLIDHLTAVAPWHVRLDFKREFAEGHSVDPSRSRPSAPWPRPCARCTGRDVTLQGDGGSIPLCNVLQETFPDAEIMLLGVEEALCLIHAPNESVDPSEIENMALVEALFLQKCATSNVRDLGRRLGKGAEQDHESSDRR